jgi:hypothetical protein
MSKVFYEDYKKCLIDAILYYIENFSKYVKFGTFNERSFLENCYNKYSYNLMLFFNSWVYENKKVIFDPRFDNNIIEVNSEFLSTCNKDELSGMIGIFQVLSNTQGLPFLNICPYSLEKM